MVYISASTFYGDTPLKINNPMRMQNISLISSRKRIQRVPLWIYFNLFDLIFFLVLTISDLLVLDSIFYIFFYNFLKYLHSLVTISQNYVMTRNLAPPLTRLKISQSKKNNFIYKTRSWCFVRSICLKI